MPSKNGWQSWSRGCNSRNPCSRAPVLRPARLRGSQAFMLLPRKVVMLAIVHSRASIGVSAPEVTVEVHLSGGLPALSIVGLPETGVRESKDRVRSALLNAAFEFPARRITINLAPADLPKEGSRFDLPIALGILAASGQIPAESLKDLECIGELSLDGALRPLKGILPAVLAAREAGRSLLLPQDNADEAALASNGDVLAASHLLTVCEHLRSEERRVGKECR